MAARPTTSNRFSAKAANFPPHAEFSRAARVKSIAEYEALYRRAEQDPEEFWGECANELSWFKPFDKVLEWNFPFAKWFVGGKINASYNCLDRHLTTARRNKAALIWEGEPGDVARAHLPDAGRARSRARANALKSLGVKEGDRVAIYMPLVPEAAIAMLACARIGAIHSVVFGGFSAEALADRINDAEAKVVHHGGRRMAPRTAGRRSSPTSMRRSSRCPSITQCLVLRRTGAKVEMRKGRDVWWDELIARAKLRVRAGRSSTPSIRCLRSTPPARPASPRASCIRPAATWYTR